MNGNLWMEIRNELFRMLLLIRLETFSLYFYNILSFQQLILNYCILIKCIKLKEVIIFRYDGEKDLSYNLKTGFFEKYTHNIKTEFYR
jgi:hypothetical protein